MYHPGHRRLQVPAEIKALCRCKISSTSAAPGHHCIHLDKALMGIGVCVQWVSSRACLLQARQEMQT